MRGAFLLAVLALAAGAYFWVGRTPAKPAVTLLVNGQADGRLVAGQPGELSFRLSWKGSEPITSFDLEHEKLMHLVIVSADYASYAHVHPVLDPATGWFKLPVNQPVTDPDNKDAPGAFARPGRYHMFAEVKPHDHPFIVMYTFDLEATGAPAAPVPLTPDAISGTGEIQKKLDPYRVTLRVSRGGLDQLRFVTLAFHIEHSDKGEYKPAKDLENWLSMPGHAILLSENGARADDKVFRHLHAAMGDAEAGSTHAGSGSSTASPKRPEKYGPDLEFYLRAAEIPPPGVYKLWGQFKHRGTVLTFPFVIKL